MGGPGGTLSTPGGRRCPHAPPAAFRLCGPGPALPGVGPGAGGRAGSGPPRCPGVEAAESLRAFPPVPGRRVPVALPPGTLRLARVPLGRRGVRSETLEAELGGGAGGQAAGQGRALLPSRTPSSSPALLVAGPRCSGARAVFQGVFLSASLRGTVPVA